MKKRLVFIICLLLTGSLASFGQKVHLKRPPNPELRRLKIQVVTRHMDLTPSQRKRFMPLYTEYANTLLVVYRQKHALRKNPNSQYVVRERLHLDQRILSIKQSYQSRFLQIISPKQLSKMYRGEDEFKQLLIERWRHGKNKAAK